MLRPKTKKWTFLFAIIAALAMVAAACGDDSTSPADSGDAADTADDSGDAAGDSGDAADDSGDAADTADDSGDAAGDSGDAADDSGDAADTADDSGDAAGDDAAAEDQTLQVALLIPGLANDNSFSQAGADGLIQAAEADGAVEYEIVEEIAEVSDSLPVLRDFANRGYDLVIGHGIEYVDPISQLHTEFPDVNFGLAGGILVPDFAMADNLNDWLYGLEDVSYPLGVLAAHAVIGDTIGIIGGPELGFVATEHEAFRLGATSVNPDLNFLEGYTGNFFDVSAAAEVAQSFIDQGASAVYCSGDGICIGVAQAAAAAGVPAFFSSGPQFDTAPDVFIAATQIKTEPTYTEWFARTRAGDYGNVFHPAGIFNRGVELLPINMEATVELAVSLEELQQIADDFVASIDSGEFEMPFLS